MRELERERERERERGGGRRSGNDDCGGVPSGDNYNLLEKIVNQ